MDATVVAWAAPGLLLSYSMKYSVPLKLTGYVLGASIFLNIAEASIQRLCAPNIATTSVYYTPDVSKICGKSNPCKAFKKEVRMQGSGTLPGGKIYTHQGKTHTLTSSCDTTIGSSGKCLIPFISVAADMRYYEPGDIIQMPSLKGKVINLPDGSKMIHPGYLIVQDTGGAIRGPNRFDFYMGSMGLRDARTGKINRDNSFGYAASKDTRMVDKSECSDSKSFTVVRRGSVSYETSLAAIDDALRNVSDNNRVSLASITRHRFPAGFQ